MMKIPHRTVSFEVSRDVQGNAQGNIADPTPTTEGGFT